MTTKDYENSEDDVEQSEYGSQQIDAAEIPQKVFFRPPTSLQPHSLEQSEQS